MKFLIIILFFQIGLMEVVVGQSSLAGLNVPTQLWMQCRNENPIDNNSINRFNTRDFTNRNMAFNCFTRCVLERMGIIRNDDLYEENAQILLRSPEVRRCANLQGTQGLDRCEKAFRIYECLQQMNGNIGSVLTFSELH